jgi:hypothetical protein
MRIPACIASLALCWAAWPARAQWSTNPATYVTVRGGGHYTNLCLAGDSRGGAYFVWQETGAGDPRIKVQRVTAAGTLAWTNPVDVSSSANQQLDPVAAGLPDGSVMVGWRERIPNTPQFIDVLMLQRIDATGQWSGPTGLALTPTNWNCALLQLASGGDGAVLACWRDGRVSADKYDLYAERVVGATGTKSWNPFGYGVPVATNGTNQNPVIIPSGPGAAIVGWEHKVGPTFDIYAQRIGTNGALEWVDGGRLVCDATNNQARLTMIPDGNEGAFLAWDDARNSASNSLDVYVQRISRLGSRYWTFNGIGVFTNFLNNNTPHLVYDGATGVIVSASEWDASFTDCDITAQRLTSAGSRLWSAFQTNALGCGNHQLGGAARGDAHGQLVSRARRALGLRARPARRRGCACRPGCAAWSGQADQVGADVAVADGAVVGAPVVHHRVDVAERALPVCAARTRWWARSGWCARRACRARPGRSTVQPSAICSAGPQPLTRLRRHMVTGMPPRCGSAWTSRRRGNTR